MKTLAPMLRSAFVLVLQKAAVPPNRFWDYQKWLRFYLDFCMKYRHPPRDPDSLEPFLQKLASKNQPKLAQEQAAHSVALYYALIKTWGVRSSAQPQAAAGVPAGETTTAPAPAATPPAASPATTGATRHPEPRTGAR